MLWVPVHPLDCPPNYIGCQADRAKPLNDGAIAFLQKWLFFFLSLLPLLILDHGGSVESFPVNSFHVLTVGSLWKKKEVPQSLCDCPADYKSSITLNFTQSSWQHILWLRSSRTATARHRRKPRDVCVPTGLSSWPTIVRLFKRPIHPRACELDITIPITGLTRQVSAAHLLRRLFRRFWRRERLTPAKGEDTFNISCRFRLPSFEMKWISHVGGETLAFTSAELAVRRSRLIFLILWKRKMLQLMVLEISITGSCVYKKCWY